MIGALLAICCLGGLLSVAWGAMIAVVEKDSGGNLMTVLRQRYEAAVYHLTGHWPKEK